MANRNVIYIPADNSFGNALGNIGQMLMQKNMADEEEKRRLAAQQALFDAYVTARGAEGAGVVAPLQEQAKQAAFSDIAAQRNLASATAPITTSPDTLADTRSLKFLSMTPQERQQAGLTPEQSAAIDAQMQGEGPINIKALQQGAPAVPATGTAPASPAVPSWQQTMQPIAQATQGASMQAQDLLTQAQERYSPEILAKLAPMIGKGVPAAQAIALAEQLRVREEQKRKQSELQAAVKDAFNPKNNYTDEEKFMKIAGVDSEHPYAKMLLTKIQKENPGFTLGQGQTRYDAQGRPIASVAPRPEGMTEYQTRTLALREKEKDKNTYLDIPELGGRITTEQALKLEEQYRPKETVVEDEYGKKTTRKEGNPELYNIIRNARQNANKNKPTQAPAQSDQSDLNMDLIKEGISVIGEEAMKQKIAAKYGPQVAEEWISRSRNYTR